MLDALVWVVTNLGLAVWNILYAISHPGLWLNWSTPEAIMRFVYFGGSVQFFFACFVVFLIVTVVGIFSRRVLWSTVVGLEWIGNTLGRIFAWAGLIMVIQQIVVIFMQRIFAVTYMGFGLGSTVEFELSWWTEELKLYNAAIVAFCVSYTFIQKGHVRVDLIYAPVSFRAKKVIDMVGSLIFMMPMAVVSWMYSWYFMWRHLITPKVSASDTLDRMLAKSRAFRWNVETIGFSPNGFTAYFLFKVLMVAFCGLVFLQACAFFWRSWLEYREGEDAADKYLDTDGMTEAAIQEEATGETAPATGS